MHVAHMFALVPIVAFVGCGGTTSNGPDADIVTYNCAADMRAQQYSVGLDVKGIAGLIDFKLMSADPAPPARGDNTWEVQLAALTNGSAGDLLAGATLKASPWMPDHQHGSPITIEITDEGSGMYKLTPVNLWMPGYWETTIQATSSIGKDMAVYKFCLPE